MDQLNGYKVLCGSTLVMILIMCETRSFLLRKSQIIHGSEGNVQIEKREDAN